MYEKKDKKNISLCKKNFNFLKHINSLNSKQKKKYINFISTKSEINSVIEIFINFLNRNIKCRKGFLNSIKKHKKHFFKITKKSNSLNKKKKLLTSKVGGFLLQSILGIAIPLLTRMFMN